jgi:hypothetical protein
METFTRDNNFILRKVGLDSFSTPDDVIKPSVREKQMRMIIHDNFRLREKEERIRACVTPGGVTTRLWKVFALSGYIGENVKRPDKVNTQFG